MPADPDSARRQDAPPKPVFRRLAPLAAVAVAMAVVFAMGWHRELSLTTLVRDHQRIVEFVAAHRFAAVASFVGLYAMTVALSIPAGAVLTITGGFLFGAVVGGLAAMTGATIGATAIFLVARSAFGEHLLRRAGPLAARLADGFQANAFSYMLFLRLVPAFPFWLVNLAPALFGVGVATYVTATVIGIIPATFAFAFFGSGLGSAIVAQETAYKECLASGRGGCEISLDPTVAITPELIVAIAVLVVVGFVPILVKRIGGRRRAAGPSGRGPA